MELFNDVVGVLRTLLDNCDHQPNCPEVGNDEIPQCPCGHATARQRAADLLSKVDALAKVHEASDF